MENNDQPYILEETDDFAVVFKPSKMHSVPLKQKDGNTIREWYASRFPPVVDIMHRLDFETHGLVLFAKNPKSFDFFKSLQDSGDFVKEYSAVCASGGVSVNVCGFPSPPADNPRIIMSYFRPFGPGRKLVRPVTDDQKKYREIAKDMGGFYRTEITGKSGNVFTVRIKRGFRHQIRCHLCWIGRPILNDPLYPQPADEETVPPLGELALRAHALFFTDPSNGKPRECRIPELAHRVAPCPDAFIY